MDELDDWLLIEISHINIWVIEESKIDDLFDRYTVKYAEILWKSMESVETQAHTRILTILSNEYRNGI